MQDRDKKTSVALKTIWNDKDLNPLGPIYHHKLQNSNAVNALIHTTMVSSTANQQLITKYYMDTTIMFTRITTIIYKVPLVKITIDHIQCTIDRYIINY